MTCSLCDGPLACLGCLGELAHYQCRDCGIQSSSPVDEPPADDFDPELADD